MSEQTETFRLSPEAKRVFIGLIIGLLSLLGFVAGAFVSSAADAVSKATETSPPAVSASSSYSNSSSSGFATREMAALSTVISMPGAASCSGWPAVRLSS